MLSILPQILIFASLGVIIYIVARKIPQMRELGRNRQLAMSSSAQPDGVMKKAVQGVGEGAKGIFVWLAEGFVKKSKNLLHLVHFWLIKMKKGKKENDMLSEIEAKQELIKEEEKSLEKVINEDLAQPEMEEISIFREERMERTRPMTAVEEEAAPPVYAQPAEEETFQLQHKKIEQYFGDEKELVTQPEDVVEQPTKKGFMGRFWKKKEATDDWKEDIYGLPKEQAEAPLFKDSYSDGIVAQGEVSEGIVKIEKKPLFEAESEDRLMKEVVTVKRKAEDADPDEELGIDRRILEKKIIQKIAKNPKDIENYRQLGELYIKMKEFTDAEESYKQILKIAARDMDAKRKLEKIKLLKRLS